MKRASILAFCCLFVCLMAGSAFAGGFGLFEWSNRGIAMGTSNYAIGNDASVIAYNPSLMTQFEDAQIMAGFATVTPSTDVNITDSTGTGAAGEYSTSDQVFVVPHAYYVHPYNEDVAFGVGVFTRFGLGTKYDDDWGGRFMLQEIMLSSFSVQPSVAFQVTDEFAIGFGAEFIKGSMQLKRALPVAVGGGTAELDVEGVSAGATISANYKFDEYWTLGFNYRSGVNFTGNGNVDVDGHGGPFSDGDATVSAKFPSSYTLGLGYSDERKWSVESSVIFTTWEDFDKMSFDYEASTGLPDNDEEFYYKNTWRIQLGGEYFVTESIALRAGYAYDQTPTRHETSSVMLPANDRMLYSLGMGILGENWTCDLSAMYVKAKARHGMSTSVDFDGDYDYDYNNGETWIFGISGGYSF